MFHASPPPLSSHLDPIRTRPVRLARLHQPDRRQEAPRHPHAPALQPRPHGSGWPFAEVAEAVGRVVRTVECWKKRFVEKGLKAALRRKPQSRRSGEIVFDGKFRARLLALACSDALESFACWTLRLLVD